MPTYMCPLCYEDADSCLCDDSIFFNPEAIHLPSAEVIGRPSSVNRLAIVYKSMEISRRSILNFLNNQFMAFEGEVITADGIVISSIGIDVDAIFKTDADPSERFMTRFLHFSLFPPVQRAQHRTIERLLCLWLGLAIKHRKMAERIIR